MLAELSSILQFAFKILDAITGIFAGKRDDLKEMKGSLREIEAELRKAIAERRVTDAAALRVRRDELKEMIKMAKRGKMHKGTSVDVRSISNAIFACVVAMSVFCCGCFSTKRDKPNLPLVIGERIIFVDPGQNVVVPPLKEPAATWYLIDDCALDQWLGISLDAKEED